MAAAGGAIPIILLLTSAVSTGVSVYESKEAGAAAQNAANFKAKELQQQALEAQQSAGQQVAAQEQKNMAILASIRANAAASGVDPSAGSALVTYDTSSEQARINEMYTKYSGNLYSQGLQTEAALTQYQGATQASAANWQAAGAGLSGVISTGKIASDFYIQ